MGGSGAGWLDCMDWNCGVYGVHYSPAIRDYWKHHDLHPDHSICDYMSQTHFEEIKRFFHVSPHDAPLLKDRTTGKRLWCFNIRVPVSNTPEQRASE